MGVMKEWLRRNFSLKQPERDQRDEFKLRLLIQAQPDLEEVILRLYEAGGFDLVRDALALKNCVEDMINDPDIVGEHPAARTMDPDVFGGILAAAYPVLRIRDDDWKALDHKTAAMLYLGIAQTMLKMAYDMEGRDDEEGV